MTALLYEGAASVATETIPIGHFLEEGESVLPAAALL